jgi:2'-5' RNA ligase
VTSGERLRLFVAADVPADHLARINELTSELRARLPDARWTEPANQHVTLKFLGATPAESLAGVTRVCATVAAAHGSASIRFSGLGAFPNPRRARVVWMGIDDSNGLLERLATTLDAGFRGLGFAPEERAYTPHLTLARFKSPASVGDLLNVAVAEDWEPTAIDHLSLYRSRLSPRGAAYQQLGQFALA